MRRVRQSLKEGKSLYAVDEEMLRELAPDVVLTQGLCQVCAPSGDAVSRVLKALPQPPRVIRLTPTNLNDIFDTIIRVGKETGTADEAHDLVGCLKRRVNDVANTRHRLQSHPRVFCMEWITPPTVRATGCRNSSRWRAEWMAWLKRTRHRHGCLGSGSLHTRPRF